MSKRSRKLTAAEKAARRRRKRETMIIFINGKQNCVKREPTIEGMSVDEYMRRNADPVWLQQNGMWEYMEPETGERPNRRANSGNQRPPGVSDTIDELPF